MFQSLRANSQFFILHKDKQPYIETGSVISVTSPIPKFPVPQNYGQPQEMVVDVVVRVNGQSITYSRLPANQDIADFGNGSNIVVASSRDAMNSEIYSLRQKSVDIVNSIEFHRESIVGYDSLLQQINPEFAEKQRQQNEINSLKDQVAVMSQNVLDLINQNKELMAKLNSSIKN